LKRDATGQRSGMSMKEPGLDRHEWETEWEALQEELVDAPEETLPALADLVERMLVGRGFDVGDPVAREGDEREVVAEYQAAREIADQAERGDGPDPGDIGQAIEGLRSIYEFLLEERTPP
jgi:hypothetical protein